MYIFFNFNNHTSVDSKGLDEGGPDESRLLGFLTNNSAPRYLALNLGGAPLGVDRDCEFFITKNYK